MRLSPPLFGVRPPAFPRPSTPLPVRGFLSLALALSLGLTVGLAIGRQLPLAGAQPSAASEAPPVPQSDMPLTEEQRQVFAVFWEAWSILRDEYLHRAGLDDRLLTYGAIRGLAQSVGDPNTRFRPPRENRLDWSGFAGRFEGVGIHLDVRDGRFVVSSPIEGSPAQQAGVRPGDVILAVDGEPTQGWELQQLIDRVRGPRGTTVSLTLQREGGAEPLVLSLVRDEIRLISARGEVLESGIGLLRLSSFTERTDAETGAVLEELQRQGVQALVIDVRRNSGGLLNVAAEVASRFLPSGPIMKQEHGNGHVYVYERSDRPLLGWPTVVLVDEGTASAAEAFAIALRDAQRARVVGQQTFGKGTVQHLHQLSDGSGFYVTAARWTGPAGTYLDKEGLVPDIQVEGERTEGSDPILQAGLRVLREDLASRPSSPARWCAGDVTACQATPSAS